MNQDQAKRRRSRKIKLKEEEAEIENLKSKFASLELENQRLLVDLHKVSIEKCKRCCAEASMKTEIRKKENAGSMEAWSYAQYAGETEREKHRKLYF